MEYMLFSLITPLSSPRVTIFRKMSEDENKKQRRTNPSLLLLQREKKTCCPSRSSLRLERLGGLTTEMMDDQVILPFLVCYNRTPHREHIHFSISLSIFFLYVKREWSFSACFQDEWSFDHDRVKLEDAHIHTCIVSLPVFLWFLFFFFVGKLWIRFVVTRLNWVTFSMKTHFLTERTFI
jgi:hypothetical protein